MTELALTVSRKINAPADKLFNAWLDPEMLAKFMIPGTGMTVPQAASDPVVGGRFDILMQAGENQIPHHGIYKTIEPHTKLAFTWQSPYSVDDSTVTLTFTPTDGGTNVELNHVKFADAETRDNHAGGWQSILQTLDAVFS